MATKPYSGFQRKLIIAFDVGTTFSGVSYAVLIPRELPLIHGVTKFPGQHNSGGDCKIPSVVCYDESGTVVAVGSEADPDVNPELLEVEDLVRAEWFKLHLRPPHLAAEQGFNVKNIPALPPNKTVIDIFSDLLKYLYQSTKEHIRQRLGGNMWESFHNNIDFVLSHPNGWEGKQQSEMRHAAISAGLVTSKPEATKRISFVTEGEASLHFCLNKIPDALQERYRNDGILVADCGGGTLDISTYARSSGNQFKEIAPAECLLQGSIFVNRRAQAFLTDKLRGSKFGSPEDIDIMTRYFDKTTKPSFRGSSKLSFIRFGLRENDPQFDIRNGNVKVDGAQIAKFFEPAIQSIIKAIEGQFKKATKAVKVVVMVGGFSTSDYLFSQLEDHFKMKGITILRPDAYLTKAVAEGSLMFTLDHSVSSRMAKYTYGIESCTLYDSECTEHRARVHTAFQALSGEILLPKSFSEILAKGTEVSEGTEFTLPYSSEYTRSQFRKLTTESVIIKCYRNRNKRAPAWIDMEPEFFVDLCQVTANVSGMKKSIQSQPNRRHGETRFWTAEYDVILLFGSTELKAQIAWKEDGVKKRGPASIIYDVTPTVNT